MAVALVGLTMRPGEFSYLLPILRLTAIFAAVPAIFIVLQLLPVNFVGLSHPIWDSAAEALRHPLRGSISVDTGATLLALCRYVSVVAIIFVATAVAIDRQQAGWLLTALMIATTIIAVIVIGHELGAFTSPNKNIGTDARDSIALGIVFSTATAIRTFERHETRRRHAEISTTGFTFFLLASLYLFCGVLDCNQFQRNRTFNFCHHMRACNSDNRCFDPTPWSRLMGLFRNNRDCNGCCYLNSRSSPTDSDDGFDPGLRHSRPTRVDHRAHFG